MTTVVPAILPESFEDLKEKIERVHEYVDRIQIDVVDGKFAQSVTWPYNESDTALFETLVHEEDGLLYRDTIHYEIDMMVENPRASALDWVQAGARSIIVHYGSTDDISGVIKALREAHSGVGLAIRPSIENDEIEDLLDKVDFVQIMGNDKIGYHGVELDSRVYEKAEWLKSRVNIIAVDIGVNKDSAPKLVEAGVNKLVMGSAIYGSDNIEKAIAHFKAL